MKALQALRRFPLLALLLAAVLLSSSVFIPLSGAAWRQTLGISGNISANADLWEQGQDCTQPLEYWRDHPDAWPASLVSLGGVVYSQEQALNFLEINEDSPILETLKGQLLVARLNVLQGADGSIANPLIEEADLVLELSATAEGLASLELEHVALLSEALAYYNTGLAGPGQCPDPTPTATPVPTAGASTCTLPLLYWVAHPDSWSLEEIEAGGIIYPASEAADLLRVAPQEEISLQLRQQIIAAQLNLAAGADLGEWLAMVQFADDWLRQHPPGTPLNPDEMEDGRNFVTTLNGLLAGRIGPGACPEAIPLLSATPTSLPTSTPTLTPTATPTRRPSDTPQPSPTPQSTATLTETLSITPTLALSATATRTPTGEPALEDCTSPLAFWVDYPDDWPAGQILIAGERVQRQDALDLLQLRDASDVRLLLVQQLIVTHLNLLQGADPSDAAQAILAADAWLVAHPAGSDLDEGARSQAMALTELLQEYNNGETGPGACPEDRPSRTPTATRTPREEPWPTPPPEETSTLTPTRAPTFTPTFTPTPPAPTPTLAPTREPTPTLPPESPS